MQLSCFEDCMQNVGCGAFRTKHIQRAAEWGAISPHRHQAGCSRRRKSTCAAGPCLPKPRITAVSRFGATSALPTTISSISSRQRFRPCELDGSLASGNRHGQRLCRHANDCDESRS